MEERRLLRRQSFPLIPCGVRPTVLLAAKTYAKDRLKRASGQRAEKFSITSLVFQIHLPSVDSGKNSGQKLVDHFMSGYFHGQTRDRVTIHFLSGSPRPPKNGSFRTIHSSPTGAPGSK